MDWPKAVERATDTMLYQPEPEPPVDANPNHMTFHGHWVTSSRQLGPYAVLKTHTGLTLMIDERAVRQACAVLGIAIR